MACVIDENNGIIAVCGDRKTRREKKRDRFVFVVLHINYSRKNAVNSTLPAPTISLLLNVV